MRRKPAFPVILAPLFVLVAALAAPVPAAFASRPDTDVIYGTEAGSGPFADEDRPDIACDAAIVVGADGTVYFERDADEELKIASITKVMTAIVALENADLDTTVTVDHAAATVGQSSADLKEGDTLPLSTALKALLMASGNDSAMAIATTVGAIIDPESSDPYQTFVDAMNDKATELGMDHTVFENPHGLDFDGWEGDFHSSARDVATMFSYAMQNDDFRAIEADDDNRITVTSADGADRSIKLIERNKILGRDGNIGGKTGGTYIALDCFVGAFSREAGGEVYTVTLGSDGEDQRWADTLALANWYYDHVVDYPLVTSSKTAASGDPLVARVAHADWSDKTVGVTAEDSAATVPVFSLAGDVDESVEAEPVHGSVRQGQEVGTLTLSQGGKEIASVKLVAAEDQDAPNPLEWVLVQLDRLVRFVTGEPGEAATQEYLETPAPTDLDAAA